MDEILQMLDLLVLDGFRMDVDVPCIPVGLCRSEMILDVGISLRLPGRHGRKAFLVQAFPEDVGLLSVVQRKQSLLVCNLLGRIMQRGITRYQTVPVPDSESPIGKPARFPRRACSLLLDLRRWRLAHPAS